MTIHQAFPDIPHRPVGNSELASYLGLQREAVVADSGRKTDGNSVLPMEADGHASFGFDGFAVQFMMSVAPEPDGLAAASAKIRLPLRT